LTTRVARALRARQAEVVVVRGKEGEDLLPRLDKDVRVISVEGDREDEEPPEADQRPLHHEARSSFLRIFPVGLFGRAGTNSMVSGSL